MISAIVLAAGKSTRMGANNKMLLPFRGSTVIETTVNALIESEVDEIIVVENQDGAIANHLDKNLKVKVICNMDADQGLTTSIQCGVEVASNDTSAFLICLGDMPLLSFNDYNRLINKLIDYKQKVILLPFSDGKRGNPVLFSHHFKENILQLEEKNGCKPIILNNQNYLLEVPFSNNHCYADIDTMEDYNRIKNS